MPWVSAMWCVRCSSVAASVDAGSCWCKGVGQCGGGQCDPVWAVEVFMLGEGLAESPFGGVKVAEHSVADALPVCDGAAVVASRRVRGGGPSAGRAAPGRSRRGRRDRGVDQF